MAVSELSSSWKRRRAMEGEKKKRMQAQNGGDVPRLLLSSSANSVSSSASFSESPLASAMSFLESIAPRTSSAMPSRASTRIETWKARMQRKRRLPSGLEWDSLTSTPKLVTPKPAASQRFFCTSGGRKKIDKAMAPTMFARTEAMQLMQLLKQESKSHLAAYKLAPPPSRTVPKSFPGYKQLSRIEGSWAYEPPDTRQLALNEWFLKRAKRSPPSIDKVHVAFGRVTYPYSFGKRKKRAPPPPEPVVEVPKMLLAPRMSIATRLSVVRV